MISFGTPVALLSLLTLLPLGGAMLYRRRRDRQADAALGGAEPLRRGRSPARRRLRYALLAGALVLAALAAARPQWGTSDQQLTRRGIDIAIVLDISRSMTASDVAPTRAEAAVRGLNEMLDHLRGDRVGLVTFAGSTFLRSPLTLDLDAIRQLLAQAQSEAPLLRAGTNVSAALREAIRLLKIEGAAATQVVVIVSDGEGQSLDFIDDAIDRLNRDHVRVYAVVAGTDAGVDIPANSAGALEHTAVDRATLARVADRTGGKLRDTDSVPGLAVEFARLRQSQFETADRAAPVERYQWLLAAALVLLLAQSMVSEGARPQPLRASSISLGATALITAAIVACGGSAAYGHVSDGNAAYDDGRFDEALTAYRQAAELLPDDPAVAYDAGNALHRLRRFEEAAVASSFAAAATEDAKLFRRATYALGSHAFERGALEQARDAFIDVLRRDPDDGDARHNLELVLLALQPPLPAVDAEPDSGPPPDRQEDGDGAAAGPQAAPAGGGAAPSPGPQTGGEPTAEETLQAAQAALAEAIVESGTEVTLEEALELLDLVRLVSELQGQARSGPARGNFPAR